MPNANTFREDFFEKTLGIADLKQVHDTVRASSITLGGKAIPAAIHIKGNTPGAPFCILAQLHGNEPAGLAGIALAMALADAGLLEKDVIGVIGNPLAAAQYFAAWEKAPQARQETRDALRCGLGENGELLPDLNRIPIDFLSRDASDHHTKRAQELWAMAQHISGILDIHSARGNMTCITDHKRDSDLKYSPIRALLTDLAEAISANASGAASVQTLKTILHPLDNILCQTGIEAGRHEDPRAPHVAAAFTLATLYNLGITKVQPLNPEDDGIFTRYSVQPRLTYADLLIKGEVGPDDIVYMVQAHGDHCHPHQYDEMEAVEKGQLLAIADKSGAGFFAPYDFSGIFFSKSGELYDKDPAVGPWPVAADKLGSVKFCYPCNVSQMKLDF